MGRRVGAAALFPLLIFVTGIASPSKAKVHGFTLSGTVTSVDEAKKTLVVKSASGKHTTLVWTNATSVFGGKLTSGQAVTVRYLDKDGRHIATSIRIGPSPASPRPASAPSPVAPTPTASAR